MAWAERQPVCPVCKKPVGMTKLSLVRHGEIYHLACVAPAERRQAWEDVAHADDVRAAAQEAVARARNLRRRLACAICGKPIVRGGSGWSRLPDQRDAVAHLTCLERRGPAPAE